MAPPSYDDVQDQKSLDIGRKDTAAPSGPRQQPVAIEVKRQRASQWKQARVVDSKY
jgi:hypothetical protein